MPISVDRYSRFENTYFGCLVAIPFGKANQTDTIKTLEIINLYYGVLLQIQSENWSHFKCKLIQEFVQEHNKQWNFYIPNYPQERETSESLNVAVATSIICAEFRRRMS